LNSHISGPVRLTRTLEVIMIDKMFAEHFATDWIASWNAHDLDRILSHYTDDFEMSSPVIIKVADESSGTLKGKEAVGPIGLKLFNWFRIFILSWSPRLSE